METETRFIERDDLRKRLRNKDNVVVVDVRSAADHAAGHVDGAVNIPIDQLGARVGKLPRDATIVTVCNAGGRSCRNAVKQLNELGYDAQPLRGGTKGWLEKK